MIHSLAGGFIKELEYADFVKVKILAGEDEGKLFWYTTDLIDISVGDRVEISLKGKIIVGEVVKIERNLNNQTAPIPIKRTLSIIRKL
ncbi:MAG: hypothetical protein IKQ31_01540 [Clostridia bacterium]|nr:hypothetical protein [Clostridia bacterium]